MTTQSNRTEIFILFFLGLVSTYPYYISSSQILSRSSSIESASYQDSPNTTQAETSIIKKERSASYHSNSSSLLSIKNQQKKVRSNLSNYSKTQETVDTAPFTIDSPKSSSINEKKPHNDKNNTRSETVNKFRQPSSESSQSTTPEINTEEKLIDDE